MRALLVAVLLTGCGPDLSKVVTSCDAGDLQFESEIAVDCDRFRDDAARARAATDSLGLPRHWKLVVIRDVEDLQPELPGPGVTTGFYLQRPTFDWVELAKDGRALLHELLHSYGYAHDERNQWVDQDVNRAVAEFESERPRWVAR